MIAVLVLVRIAELGLAGQAQGCMQMWAVNFESQEVVGSMEWIG
jgi:hypothetical protein